MFEYFCVSFILQFSYFDQALSASWVQQPQEHQVQQLNNRYTPTEYGHNI